MRYHDYHLDRYEVSDRGQTITLHLVYGYPGQETDYSCIRFVGVALYSFVHTQNAIITDISEVSIPELLSEYRAEVDEWNRMYGLKHWKDSVDSYGTKLQDERCRAWYLESAIGFHGFVVAQAVENPPPNPAT